MDITTMKNIILRIGIFLGMILLWACSREECETVVRYKAPIVIELALGESVETYHGIYCNLKSIDMKMVAVQNETTGLTDSVLTAIACSVALGKPGEAATDIKLYTGNFEYYGEPKVRDGRPFEHLRLMCNSVSISPEKAQIAIWDATFMQDCKPWEE